MQRPAIPLSILVLALRAPRAAPPRSAASRRSSSRARRDSRRARFRPREPPISRKVQFTAADVKFMQGMIGHHAQAVEMVALLPTRTSQRRHAEARPAHRGLAGGRDQDDAARGCEARGQQVPGPHAHHMHGAPLMPGMLTPEEMARLAAAKGAEFDRLFLEGMIKHHGGALTMVKELFATPGAGQESEIFAFASDVEADQRMEIERMGAMLAEGAAEMKSVAARLSGVSAVACWRSPRRVGAQEQAAGRARQRSARRAEGRAARRRRRRRATWSCVASLPKPRGLLRSEDAGRRADAEPRDAAAGSRGASRAAGRLRQPPSAPPSRAAAWPAASNFANSDLAFSGTHLFIGNFNGFNIYDIETPKKPQAARVDGLPRRPGRRVGHGNLLFMSVEQTRGRLDCGTQGVADAGERRALPRRPHLRHHRHQASRSRSRRCRPAAARTRTRWSPTRSDKANIYVYGSGTERRAVGRGARRLLGPGAEGRSEHGALQHRRDPGAARRAGEGEDRQPAAHLRRPDDRRTSPACGRAATTARARRRRRATNQCHDITVFPEIGLAAGACSGNGILLDISRSGAPDAARSRSTDKNFAYWHSATFNNDGTKVIFTDEWGGGTRPRCRATDLLNWGADAIFDIVDQQAEVQRATTRCRRRRPSRRTASRTTAR